ncbi:hypothetical protein SDC9_118763 [bioreactor metagenome]|uniref:Uncharacterized protein n=1 Tax=bioreactor metagenome TaxID=1076179 RepID=A0A645C2C7_9ZZZZ
MLFCAVMVISGKIFPILRPPDILDIINENMNVPLTYLITSPLIFHDSKIPSSVGINLSNAPANPFLAFEKAKTAIMVATTASKYVKCNAKSVVIYIYLPIVISFLVFLRQLQYCLVYYPVHYPPVLYLLTYQYFLSLLYQYYNSMSQSLSYPPQLTTF